jgi:hypothetical protein
MNYQYRGITVMRCSSDGHHFDAFLQLGIPIIPSRGAEKKRIQEIYIFLIQRWILQPFKPRYNLLR